MQGIFSQTSRRCLALTDPTIDFLKLWFGDALRKSSEYLFIGAQEETRVEIMAGFDGHVDLTSPSTF